MGTFFSGFRNRYEAVQPDEEWESTPSESRNQSNTCKIETEKPKETRKESNKNQRNINGQEEAIPQKKLKILALEKQVKELTAEKELLITRLSQISSMQLTDGNPNIADLSDPNRTDKLADQFSELYNNQWTESFQALCESKFISEEDAIQNLLQIVLMTYQFCREYADRQNQELMTVIYSFTGLKIEDKANEAVLREPMHSLRNCRAKNYAVTIADFKAEIEKSLLSSVNPNVYRICQVYIVECSKVCWLMCVKSPPMYISAKKTKRFDRDLYTSYTKSGQYVSYMVWPALFQYENGPLMKKGVAQGTNYDK